jgi:hypothetical protein
LRDYFFEFCKLNGKVIFLARIEEFANRNPATWSEFNADARGRVAQVFAEISADFY